MNNKVDYSKYADPFKILTGDPEKMRFFKTKKEAQEYAKTNIPPNVTHKVATGQMSDGHWCIAVDDGSGYYNFYVKKQGKGYWE